jgi:excisionase family DNA binding protein
MEFLTTQQAADKLRVHRSRVHALIQAGRLPAEKFGNVYMIRETDLKLVEERKIGRPPKVKVERDSKVK